MPAPRRVVSGTLGATLATEDVARAVSGAPPGKDPLPLMHGPTFMGNPLACAVAAASLALLTRTGDDGRAWWAGRVDAIEAQLREELAPCLEMDGVRDVRVLGAIGVVELDEPLDASAVAGRCRDLGVWLRPFGKLLYAMPPYVCEREDVAAIGAAMRSIARDASELR